MCGVVGIRRFDGLPVERSLLEAMANMLAHRGPDDSGYWVDGPIGFGHRRLSIIDPANSAQPMASADGQLHISFNGEILNYVSLRQSHAYPYRTYGDTEVLLAQFELLGAQSVENLRGQFAYALHTRHDDSVWLFRDRIGILPIYYYLDDDVLLFASEVKALLPALPIRLEVDEASLHDYLTGRAVPAPNTLYSSIRKIPAGHSLHVGANGESTLARYWSIPQESMGCLSPTEATILVADGLDRAVRDALVSDAPIGAYLSGGLDSSLIVALMAKWRRGDPVETFSAGFGDPRYDELTFARRVSEHLQTRHHEVVVTASDFQDLWPRLTWQLDAPLSDPADVAVFRLAELAAQHVKVVLSGEGGDELFAGYPKYSFARLGCIADLVPPTIRSSLERTAEAALPISASRALVFVRAMAARTERERAEAWFAPLTLDQRTRLLGPATRAWQPDVFEAAEGDLVRRMLFLDCHSWLADHLLERGDRMSMAASVELRPPFLDHRLIELAFSIPSRVKVRHGTTKWVLKEVAKRYLPTDIVRRRKAGFRVPVDAWLRGGLREMAHDSLLAPNSFVASVMERRSVSSILEDHDKGRRNQATPIWTLMALELWHHTFFRQQLPNGLATASRPPSR